MQAGVPSAITLISSIPSPTKAILTRTSIKNSRYKSSREKVKIVVHKIMSPIVKI